MRFVSIDVETGGFDPDLSLLQVGMAFSNGDNVEFMVEHDEYRVSLYSLQNFDFTQFDTKECVKPNRVATRIQDELMKRGDGKWVVAGKNFWTLDMRFLANYGVQEGWFHKRLLDPGSMYARRDDEVPPSLQECMRRAGLEGIVPHTALEDAMIVRDLVNMYWNRQGL